MTPVRWGRVFTGLRPTRGALALLIVALAALTSCGNPTLPCGNFAFNGSPNGNRGIDATVTFNFSPASCKAPAASSTTMAYVQIVRIIDLSNGNYLAPNSDQQNRIVTGRADATLNGWAVDRLSERIWGYYGRNNDGTFASTLTPGNDSTAAVLRDSPSGWPDG